MDNTIQKLQRENANLQKQLDERHNDSTRFRLLQQVSKEPVVEVDSSIHILWINTAASKVFKTTYEQMIGKNALDFVSPEHKELAKERSLNNYSTPYEINLLKSDGTVFPGIIHGTSFKDKNKTIRVIVIQDITRVKEQQKELQRAYDELDTFFTNSMIGVVFLRNGRMIHKINQRLAEIVGYTPEELVGQSVVMVHPSKDSYKEWGQKFYTSLINREVKNAEFQLKHKNGSLVWVNISGKAIDRNSPPDLNKGVIWIIDDISQQKEAEEKLREMAFVDFLTKANNRRFFMQLAERELEIQKRNKQSISLLMLDIDHFKRVNDIHGHQVGDVALVEFTKICQKTLRAKDILGRIGGEEFAVLLPDTESSSAIVTAERIRASIECETRSSNSDYPPISVSIGIATSNGKLHLGELISIADDNLYKAKTTGRNKVVSL